MIDAGNNRCTAGLSKALYDTLAADTNAGFSFPLAAAQVTILKALCWGLAQGIAAKVNAGGMTVTDGATTYDLGTLELTGSGVSLSYDAGTNKLTATISGDGGGSAPSGTGIAEVVSGSFTSPARTQAVVVVAGLTADPSGARSALSLGTAATHAATDFDAAGAAASAYSAAASYADGIVATEAGVRASGDATNAAAAAAAQATANAAVPAGNAGDFVTLASSGVATNSSRASAMALLYPKVSIGGTTGVTGFSGGNTISTQGTKTAAPEFGPGQSFVYLFYALAVPSSVEMLFAHAESATLARGFQVRVGDNGSARGEVALDLAGLNGTAMFQLTGCLYTTIGVPHAIGVTMKADKSVHFAVDGTLQTALSARTGSYVAPNTSDGFTIGDWVAGTVPNTSGQFIAIRMFSTELSDADLVTATASPGYDIPAVTGTVSLDMNARDFIGVKSRVFSSVRWGLNGTAGPHDRTE